MTYQLPPLPTADRMEPINFCDDGRWFSVDQMRLYGVQCIESVIHTPPPGYVMIDKATLQSWGKLDEVVEMCIYTTT